MSVLGQVETWIADTLKASAVIASQAVGGVHNRIAVQGASYPLVAFSLESQPSVTKTLCGAVDSIRAVYAVRVVAKDSGFPAGSEMEDAIDDALAVGTIEAAADGTRPRMTVTLLSPVRRVTPATADGGANYYESGGLYQFFISL